MSGFDSRLPAMANGGPSGNPDRLLVLEDDPAFGRQVLQVAEQAGFPAWLASSIAEFRKAYELVAPTVLVMDIVIGEEDICPLLDELVGAHCAVPIILLSSYDTRLRHFVASLGRGLLVADTIGKQEGLRRLARQLKAYKVG